MATLLLTGDINLMKVTDPAVPFGRVEAELQKADAVFGNLECLLYERPAGHSTSNEGFFADPEIAGAALKRAGIDHRPTLGIGPVQDSRHSTIGGVVKRPLVRPRADRRRADPAGRAAGTRPRQRVPLR